MKYNFYLSNQEKNCEKLFDITIQTQYIYLNLY